MCQARAFLRQPLLLRFRPTEVHLEPYEDGEWQVYAVGATESVSGVTTDPAPWQHEHAAEEDDEDLV